MKQKKECTYVSVRGGELVKVKSQTGRVSCHSPEIEKINRRLPIRRSNSHQISK